MSTPIESNVGGLWQGKQVAAGTKLAPNAAGIRRLRWQDGSLKPAKEIDTEPYVDGQAFPDATPFVTKVGGEVGEVTAQAQPETTGFCFAQIIGVDVVTGASDPYTHTISSSNLGGAYQTFYQGVGATTTMNLAYWDALISKLTWRVGQDQHVAHITQAVRAGKTQWAGTLPTAADAGSDPFLWSNVAGEVKIDGTAICEVDGETLEVDRNLEDYMGSGLSPCFFVPTSGSITRSVSSVVSSVTAPLIKDALFASATPADAADQSPTIKHVNLATKYTLAVGRTIEIQTPKVIFDLADLETGASPEGGPMQVTIGGRCRPSGATPALTVIATTGDAGPYV